VKEKVPEESAMTVALDGPVSATLAPVPEDAGLIVPEMLHVGGPEAEARISQILRLYRSLVGAVSLIVTTVPLPGVGALCI
jgi:hypothetical protein